MRLEREIVLNSNQNDANSTKPMCLLISIPTNLRGTILSSLCALQKILDLLRMKAGYQRKCNCTEVRRSMIWGRYYYIHTPSMCLYDSTSEMQTHTELLTELVIALAMPSHYTPKHRLSTSSISNTVKARSFQQEEVYCT